MCIRDRGKRITLLSKQKRPPYPHSHQMDTAANTANIKDEVITITSTWSKSSFLIPPRYDPYVDTVLIPQGLIESRIEKIALDIARFYENRPYKMLVLLKGSVRIHDKLTECLRTIYAAGLYSNSVVTEYIRVKSYVDDKSTGQVTITGLDPNTLKDQEVLMVEDIVDGGLTMFTMFARLREVGVKSMKLFSLVTIKENRKPEYAFDIDYLGFYIPNHHLVGYGIDYNDQMRDINHICIINQNGKDYFRSKPKGETKEASIQSGPRVKTCSIRTIMNKKQIRNQDLKRKSKKNGTDFIQGFLVEHHRFLLYQFDPFRAWFYTSSIVIEMIKDILLNTRFLGSSTGTCRTNELSSYRDSR
eukprot:TRINITY_DN379_c0_g1_i2.p1 TRINITY_DN379_c0_g1~~TRINITY_DN379_c0_g1_i2.p1  ORF type:complete len:379 (-),score=71.08 TRINITY_DN379_c0_g1_i2:245-1321(-)